MTGKKKRRSWIGDLSAGSLISVADSLGTRPSVVVHVLGRAEGCLVAPAGPLSGMCLLWRSPDLMLSYLKTFLSIYIFCRASCILSRSFQGAQTKLMSLQSHSKKWEVFFSLGVPWTSAAVTVAVNERCELSCSLQRVIKHLKHLKDSRGVWALEQRTASDMAEIYMQGGWCTTEC